jgi:hypothetical protein
MSILQTKIMDRVFVIDVDWSSVTLSRSRFTCSRAHTLSGTKRLSSNEELPVLPAARCPMPAARCLLPDA